MKLRITHRTEYLYSQPVRNSANELRLTPRHCDGQDRQFHILRVLPATRLRRFSDFHANWVNHFEIEEPHSRLVLEAQSTIATHNRFAAGEPLGIALTALAAAAREEQCHSFLQSSRYVQITPEIWRTAVDVRGGSDDVFAIARAIMKHLHQRCTYTPGVTDIGTTSEDFFSNPRGVCQDYAHLMLAMCRALQIPARYVSGYLYDAKRRDIRGAHASHAWVEVFVPAHGWFGLDPTNASLADAHYVALAIGRDYDDVAPVKGTFYGTGTRQMKVHVHIEEQG